MIKRIKRWWFYRLCRLSVRTKWGKTNILELTKVQNKTMKITMALISDNKSELLINPNIDTIAGEKYYIKKNNKSGDVDKFVSISKTSMGYSVTLIGHESTDGVKHNYHYDIWFNEDYGLVMVNKFKRVLKRRRDMMELDMRKDDEQTLELILDKLQNKK